MTEQISLAREFLGLSARIECSISALPNQKGAWVILFAAGIAAHQPTNVQWQGPFYSVNEAASMLKTIVENLLKMDYLPTREPFIWSLHTQAQLRRLSDCNALRLG